MTDCLWNDGNVRPERIKVYFIRGNAIVVDRSLGKNASQQSESQGTLPRYKSETLLLGKNRRSYLAATCPSNDTNTLTRFDME